MRLVLAALALLCSLPALAQDAPPGAGDVFEVVEVKPQIIGGLEGLMGRVTYPEMARRAGIEGKVFVQFVVDEGGAVESAVAVRCPDELLCEAAVQAVRETRFTPGRHDGRAVKVLFTIPVDFRLRDSGEAEEAAQAASLMGYLSNLLGETWDPRGVEAAVGPAAFGRVKNGEGTLIYENAGTSEVDRVLVTVSQGRVHALEVFFVEAAELLQASVAEFTERYGEPADGWFPIPGEPERIRFFPNESRFVLEHVPLAEEPVELPEALPPPPPPEHEKAEAREAHAEDPEAMGGIAALQARLVYPPEAKRDRLEGSVLIRVEVDVRGYPTHVACVRGLQVFCEAAIPVAEATRYRPATQRGRPVPGQLSIPLTFRLD